MWDCCEPPRTLGRPPRPSSRPLSPPQWNPALVWCWQDSRGRHTTSVWQDIQYINHMANRWFWKHTRQATHALEVLVGVVLVNVHLFLIYSMNFTMTYYNAPFSHLLVINWMLKILGLAQMRRQYFHQWKPRLLPSFFPPMRSELTKLNKSAHPQSRILSPFISTRVALKIVLC